MSEIPSQRIIGFDILPQSSPSSKKSPRYASVLMEGEILETNSSIRRSELLKMVRRVEPDIIATDNLLELSATEKGVIEFLSRLPSKTRVIQVTGSPVHGMTSLTKLARRHGFPVKKHPTPVETAILISQLASLGVGTEISALARETRIVVSRARTVGPGGFSQARFQRRMHGSILQTARNILDKLSKAEIDYDQYETRTQHGWSRCLIHVYESYDAVCSVVQSEVNRIAGVAVRIAPVKHRSILYLPRDGKEEVGPRRLLVVGIDAGTTVGIAITDVSGNLVALRSSRGLSRGDVIRYIVEFGKPVLLAADVIPAPSFIEKLSTTLQTQLFTPDKLMAVVEKRELAKSFTADSQYRASNSHQRDALAAVAKVFHVYCKRLELLNKRLQESEQRHSVSEATALVLQGVSVHDALDQSIIPAEIERFPSKPIKPIEPTEKLLTQQELQKIVDRLTRKVESLQRQVEYERNQHQQSVEHRKKLEKEIQQIQRQLNRALSAEQREHRRDERILQKEAEIQRLEKKIRTQSFELERIKRNLTNLKLMRRLEMLGEVQPVIVLSHFSQEEIRRLGERYPQDKKRKVVFIQDPSGGGSSTANQLVQFGVQIVITQGTMSHLALQKFSAAHIPVLDAKSLRITIVDEFAVVDVEQLSLEITKWQEHHQVSEREAAADNLERLIEEYRQERRKKTSDKR
jgi:predicted RNase H-like nuclease (RuvC/YqgF family)